VTAATAAATLALGVLVTPLAIADPKKDLEHRKHHAQQQVRHAAHDLDESSSQLRRAQGALEAAARELRSARVRLLAAGAKVRAAEVRDRQMQARLAAAEARLDAAQQALAEGQADLTEQRNTLTDTITDIYEGGDPHLLAMSALMHSRSTSDLTRQQAFDDVVVGRQKAAYDDLRAAQVLLQVREDQVQDARDDVAVQRKAAAEHLVTMEVLHREAREARDDVRAKVITRHSAKVAAVRARKHDQRALRIAKKHEERIRQLILAKARRSRGGYTGPTNGLFIRPVPGSVTSPFGWRIHPIYHYWGLHDGTDFGVSCGEGMRAIAGGTVISRYWSDVYGNRLYLSLGNINGKNVTAVYNHATGYRVGVGQHVRQGEVVGYVGSTGWSTGCHLHFTLLVNGDAVNPMNWLP
jgi:murein DD-endopeptidase MepM/ murein hydrolase activator NlpD